MELSVAGVEVVAVSVGGLETCIEIPSWKLCFDIGRCPPTAARRGRVCFTHGHTDHLGGVGHHVSLRELWGLAPPEYLVPETAVAGFERLLDAFRALDGAALPAKVVPVAPGQVVEVGPERRIHVFRSLHRVPTVGYALERVHRRLRDDLVGLPPQEIGRRRMAGEPVSDERWEVEVAFCGDTLIDVVDREPHVQRARVLILECTFLDDRVPVEKARRSGHVHLDEIVARADRFTNEAIVLTHFSTRYGPDDILRLLDRRLPPDLRARVVPLLPEAPWLNPRR